VTFVGTCHFIGWRAATRYYATQYGLFQAEAHALVKQKRKEGLIFYTAPERKKGRRTTIDKEGRYILEVGE
jgi:hypothetical protein